MNKTHAKIGVSALSLSLITLAIAGATLSAKGSADTVRQEVAAGGGAGDGFGKGKPEVEAYEAERDKVRNNPKPFKQPPPAPVETGEYAEGAGEYLDKVFVVEEVELQRNHESELVNGWRGMYLNERFEVLAGSTSGRPEDGSLVVLTPKKRGDIFKAPKIYKLVNSGGLIVQDVRDGIVYVMSASGTRYSFSLSDRKFEAL